MKKLTAIFLILSLLLCGCGAEAALAAPAAPAEAEITDLMQGVSAEPAAVLDTFDDGAFADFAVTLFQNAARDGENTLLAPLSVLSALAMTANGAGGETLAQMEAAMGMPIGELNSYMCNFMNSQTDQLKLANSIWFNSSEALQVQPDFLQTNKDYFDADLYEAPMDPQTCNAINRWVREKTEGSIPEILDEIPENAMMYLVNALAFEAEWPQAYQETSVHEGIFTREDGGEQTVQLMYSTEGLYIGDELATGFIKPYKDGKYAFAALLPREGVSLSEYVESLSGERLQAMLRAPEEITVHAAIPKFETEYGVELSEILQAMGMEHAFDVGLADFSRMGSCQEGNLYISRVLHRTRITVAEQGTRAGAATAVDMVAGTAFIPDIREVILNRPFVYMLIDLDSDLPFFIGTMADMQA